MISANEYEFDFCMPVTLLCVVFFSAFSEDTIPKILSGFECFVNVSLQERRLDLSSSPILQKMKLRHEEPKLVNSFFLILSDNKKEVSFWKLNLHPVCPGENKDCLGILF